MQQFSRVLPRRRLSRWKSSIVESSVPQQKAALNERDHLHAPKSALMKNAQDKRCDISFSRGEILASENRFELQNGKIMYVSSNHENHRGTKVSFLGTSIVSGLTDSCLLIKNGPTCLLFNCGENIYREIQRARYLQQKCLVLIASMDLQEVVGLPSMLSSGILRQSVVIYGPQGLRQYIRTTLRSCFARVPTKYTVHELILSNSLRIGNQQSEDLLHEDELYGDDLVCSKDGLCEVIRDEQFVVKASVVCRITQTWGFVYKETERQEQKSSSQVSVALMSGVCESRSFVLEATNVDILIHDVRARLPDSVCNSAKAIDPQCLVLSGCPVDADLSVAKASFVKKPVILATDHLTITILKP